MCNVEDFLISPTDQMLKSEESLTMKLIMYVILYGSLYEWTPLLVFFLVNSSSYSFRYPTHHISPFK